MPDKIMFTFAELSDEDREVLIETMVDMFRKFLENTSDKELAELSEKGVLHL